MKCTNHLIYGEAIGRFFEMSQDLMGIFDFEGNVVSLNPAWEKIFGYDAEFLQGMRYGTLIHPDDLKSIRETFHKLLRGESCSELEYRYLHIDGHYLTIKWNTTSDIDKHLIYVVGRDVTELRSRQELLQRSEKLSIVGQLAAGIAHEIRNPLTTLKGFLQLFHSKLNERNEFEDYFQIMFDEFNRIEEILGEFLILAKPQSKSIKETRMDALLTNIVKLLETQAILSNVKIRMEVDESIPAIRCDANQLKQVFVNLLKNAIEAMPDGGTATVEIKALSGHEICVRVSDEGVGIPEDKLAKLGEPFFTTKENGTGLGLMISSEIIKSHQGTLNINSREGHGTSIEILLPVKVGTRD